jgi:hypothetical protein
MRTEAENDESSIEEGSCHDVDHGSRQGQGGGQPVVRDETLPANAAVGVLVHEEDAEKWTLTDKGWGQLREASEAIDFVTDEAMQVEFDAIDAE